MRAPRTGRPRPIIIRVMPEQKPTADLLKQRPSLAPDVGPSSNAIDRLDLQQDWQARIDAGLIRVR